jgi:hypothetical protein
VGRGLRKGVEEGQIVVADLYRSITRVSTNMLIFVSVVALTGTNVIGSHLYRPVPPPGTNV